MKEEAIKAFEAVCMSYELPKGLTPQQEEDLLWNEFCKYGLEVTREQLLGWINEKQREVYICQPCQGNFEVSDLPDEGTWKLVSLQKEKSPESEQPIEVKVKINNFKIYDKS